MNRALVLATALLGLPVASCQTTSSLYDRIFSRPAQKSAPLAAIEAKAALKVLWQGSVGAAEKNVYFPARVDDVVYAAGANGVVVGFDVARGTAVSRLDAGQRVSGGVGTGGGLVLIGTPRGEVLAFGRDGKPLWKAQVSAEVLAPPQAQEGTVVVRAGGGHLYGLDAASGAQKWVYQRPTPSLTVRSHAGIVVAGGAVFAGFPGGRLVGIELATGKVGWEAVVALPRGATELERVADITSAPLLDGPRVCAAAFQGRVACFDAVRGTMLWARDVSSVAGLGGDETYVYVTDDKDAVLALDKGSGASIWRQDKLAGRRVSAPVALGRYVAVGDIEGYVHLLAREDGSFAARIATDGSPISVPPLPLDRNTLLVQTRNGGVFAINLL